MKQYLIDTEQKEKKRKVLENFLSGIKIIPIFYALDLYAKEKARLRKQGIVIDDFDLLIGTTAVAYQLTMVTNNQAHFERLIGIELQDWTKEA